MARMHDESNFASLPIELVMHVFSYLPQIRFWLPELSPSPQRWSLSLEGIALTRVGLATDVTIPFYPPIRNVRLAQKDNKTFSFKVKIMSTEGSGIWVGVASRPFPPVLYWLGSSPHSWAFYCRDGTIRHSSLSHEYDGKPPYGAGTEIEAIVKGKELRFKINGVDKGVAFTNVEQQGDLYGCVNVYSPGDCIWLLK